MSINKFAIAAAALAALVASGAQAASIAKGTYRLGNHPDGNAASPGYGLRLDELFNVSSGHDVFTFDFEAPGSAMYMDWDGSSIHIYGTAVGGRDIGSSYDPAHTSAVAIDFTYDVAHKLWYDNDIVVKTPDFSNEGSITWLETGEVIDLFDFSGSHNYTFRFGNETDDDGHRGFPGLSGWGWLDHHAAGTHIAASDWLFTAQLIPLPPAAILGLAGLAGLGIARKRGARRKA